MPHVSSTQGDTAHSLAQKVLRIPKFAGVDFMARVFHPSSVFYLASNMLEGNVLMPSLEVSHAVKVPPTNENLVVLQAKLAAEAISTFEANTTLPPIVQPFKDESLIAKVAYLSDIAA